MANPRPAPKPPRKQQDIIFYAIGAVIVIALLTFSLSRVARTSSAPSSTAAVAANETPTAPPSSSPTGQSPADPQSAAPSLPPLTSPRAGEVSPPQIQPPMQSAPTAATLASVPRIKAGDLIQQFEAKQVTIIDVRDVDSYKAAHIPGALHIPLAYIAGEVPYLPKDKPIVTYCT